MQPITQKRKILLVLISVLVVIGTILALVFWPDPNKVTIEVIASPRDSIITLDGKRINAGKTTITRGKHTLKATRQHFADDIKEFDTEVIRTQDPIYLLPEPNTPEARQWMSEHSEDQLLRERGVGAEFSETQSKVVSEFPIIDKLPYETLDYRVEYEIDESKNVRFIVTLYTASPTGANQELINEQLTTYKEAALKWMQQQGVYTDTANITFKQF